jgi:ATP-binding cassette subfamily C (CFTR/MRP) protein 1
MGKVLLKSQKAWFERIQKRVNITSEALDSMKGVKFAGLTEQLTVLLRGLRSSEVESSKPFRRLKVVNIVLCNVNCYAWVSFNLTNQDQRTFPAS